MFVRECVYMFVFLTQYKYCNTIFLSITANWISKWMSSLVDCEEQKGKASCTWCAIEEKWIVEAETADKTGVFQADKACLAISVKKLSYLSG